VLRSFAIENGRLVPLAGEGGGLPPNASWIDLVAPTDQEEQLVERALGINIPTRAEAGGIQTTDKLVSSEGSLCMSAFVPAAAHALPATIPVTFVKSRSVLVTVRYGAVDSLDPLIERCERGEVPIGNADDLLVFLLDMTVDRISDRLERVRADLDHLRHLIFHHPAVLARRARRSVPLGKRIRRLESVIENLGRQHELAGRMRESLQSLMRLAAFYHDHGDAELRPKLKAVEADLRSVADYDAALAADMEFMLDATVGSIDIQQNKVIYILSIVSVVLSPPVVVASIYGMNFEHMPELKWLLGYPWALGLMLLSAIGPFLVFKLRGWL
jgi:magnesium transporter